MMLIQTKNKDGRQPTMGTQWYCNDPEAQGDSTAFERHIIRMRLMVTIAQRINKDDDQQGKVWQSRYKAVRLLDETTLLACNLRGPESHTGWHCR